MQEQQLKECPHCKAPWKSVWWDYTEEEEYCIICGWRPTKVPEAIEETVRGSIRKQRSPMALDTHIVGLQNGVCQTQEKKKHCTAQADYLIQVSTTKATGKAHVCNKHLTWWSRRASVMILEELSGIPHG
jgi:Zn ribbon nucleic-acid-binding protein